MNPGTLCNYHPDCGYRISRVHKFNTVCLTHTDQVGSPRHTDNVLPIFWCRHHTRHSGSVAAIAILAVVVDTIRLDRAPCTLARRELAQQLTLSAEDTGIREPHGDTAPVAPGPRSRQIHLDVDVRENIAVVDGIATLHCGLGTSRQAIARPHVGLPYRQRLHVVHERELANPAKHGLIGDPDRHSGHERVGRDQDHIRTEHSGAGVALFHRVDENTALVDATCASGSFQTDDRLAVRGNDQVPEHLIGKIEKRSGSFFTAGWNALWIGRRLRQIHRSGGSRQFVHVTAARKQGDGQTRGDRCYAGGGQLRRNSRTSGWFMERPRGKKTGTWWAGMPTGTTPDLQYSFTSHRAQEAISWTVDRTGYFYTTQAVRGESQCCGCLILPRLRNPAAPARYPLRLFRAAVPVRACALPARIVYADPHV